jgi:PHD/YefM family antitoxin component YafN of YafNO toxin-antitoxin module
MSTSKAITSSDSITEGSQNSSSGSVLVNAKRLYRRLRWLSNPLPQECTPSTVFGRNIAQSLNSLHNSSSIVTLMLRNKPKAVVMSMERYAEMREMVELYGSLIAAQEKMVVQEAADDFDALYARITSNDPAKVTNALFSASPADLNNAYKPGGTESA